jgi:hypothetical protein
MAEVEYKILRAKWELEAYVGVTGVERYEDIRPDDVRVVIVEGSAIGTYVNGPRILKGGRLSDLITTRAVWGRWQDAPAWIVDAVTEACKVWAAGNGADANRL